MELDMVADMEVHKVTDKVADIVARYIRWEKKVADMELDMVPIWRQGGRQLNKKFKKQHCH